MKFTQIIPATLTATVATSVVARDWTHFAANPARLAVTHVAPPSFASPVWTLSHHAGQPVAFQGQASPIADTVSVYAIGRAGGVHHLFAVARDTGEIRWAAPIPTPSFSSWSTPALDGRNNTILVASGPFLSAFDASSGTQLWQAQLHRTTVNASPLVTSDLAPANRAFITDYDPFGSQGRLYCVNVDPFDAGVNPYHPGEIVWSVAIGATSGNTPAYHDGIVYVTCIAEDNAGQPVPGLIRAFDARATAAPQPLWTFINPRNEGFYSGIAVRQGGTEIHLYAATYAFHGGMDSANLVKVNAVNGSLLWSVSANRTASTPIPLPDGRILLSTGLEGFGTAPTVQLFQDRGSTATLLWDVARDTWIDSNNNNRMDPGEYLSVGGWMHMPAAAIFGGGATLLCGTLAPGGAYAPGDTLHVIDLSKSPTQAGFVIESVGGAGSSPAMAGGWMFATGSSGLRAFATNACYADCDRSTGVGVLDIFDFLCFSNRFALRDPYACECDTSTGTGICDIFDFLCFSNAFAAGCT